MSKYKCHCTYCDWSGDYEELRFDKNGFEVCPECWADTELLPDSENKGED